MPKQRIRFSSEKRRGSVFQKKGKEGDPQLKGKNAGIQRKLTVSLVPTFRLILLKKKGEILGGEERDCALRIVVRRKIAVQENKKRNVMCLQGG